MHGGKCLCTSNSFLLDRDERLQPALTSVAMLILIPVSLYFCNYFISGTNKKHIRQCMNANNIVQCSVDSVIKAAGNYIHLWNCLDKAQSIAYSYRVSAIGAVNGEKGYFRFSSMVGFFWKIDTHFLY